MIKYAKIINEETKECIVGFGDDVDYFKSLDMEEMEVEQAYNGSWYLQGFKPIEVMQDEVRQVRNSYLEKYVDPKQLVLVWETLTEDEQLEYKNYRQYLLDYTKLESWWEQNPDTFYEWKYKGAATKNEIEVIEDGL